MKYLVNFVFRYNLMHYGALLLVILLSFSLIRNVLTLSKADEKIEEARQRVEKLKEDNQKLKQRVAFVKTEEFIEKEARDKLGLAKPGDVILVLPDEETLKLLSPRVTEEKEMFLPDPNWKKWLDLFL